MATVTVNSARFAVPVDPPLREPATVTLTLTAEEATVLAMITGKIGGSAQNSPRAHTDSIWNALIRAGVARPEYDSDMFRKTNPGIFFEENSNENPHYRSVVERNKRMKR